MELHFNFKADIAAIAPIVQQVTELAQELGCDPGREMQIALALQEAIANAVVHGCENDATKNVDCWVFYAKPGTLPQDSANEMLITIRDPGPGFDPADAPNPKLGENLESGHGRGIYLIRQLMDEVTFAHQGREIRMRAVLNSSESAHAGQ